MTAPELELEQRTLHYVPGKVTPIKQRRLQNIWLVFIFRFLEEYAKSRRSIIPHMHAAIACCLQATEGGGLFFRTN